MGWYELLPKLPVDRILVIAASNDRFFDPRVVKRMWKRWGEPAIRWYPTSHMGFIAHLPGGAARDARVHRPTHSRMNASCRPDRSRRHPARPASQRRIWS